MENGSIIIFFFKSIGHYPSIVSIKIVNLGRICKFSHYVPICHSYSLDNKSLIVKINMSFFSLFDDVPYSQILQRCFLYLKTYNFLQDHNLLVNISVSVLLQLWMFNGEKKQLLWLHISNISLSILEDS